jgi:hypothetical protein
MKLDDGHAGLLLPIIYLMPSRPFSYVGPVLVIFAVFAATNGQIMLGLRFPAINLSDWPVFLTKSSSCHSAAATLVLAFKLSREDLYVKLLLQAKCHKAVLTSAAQRLSATASQPLHPSLVRLECPPSLFLGRRHQRPARVQ